MTDELTLSRGATQPGATAPEPEDWGRSKADLDGLPLVDRNLYVVRGEIARGGMGRILAARDRRMGRIVALKELLATGESLRIRFEREARITARLQHPAVVPIYELGRWSNGEPFYAMKHVEGESLQDAISRARDLSERLALLPRVLAVADALAYAHSQGIIHRDLKPSNILVGAFGESVVIDWGLARHLTEPEVAPDTSGAERARPGAGLTVEGIAMGTPLYMPPEQARGEPVDERADVYALGATLYHLLAGAPPYRDAVRAEDVLDEIEQRPPEPLRDLVPGVPAELLAIVEKAMARDPAARHPTARELADDLRGFESERAFRPFREEAARHAAEADAAAQRAEAERARADLETVHAERERERLLRQRRRTIASLVAGFAVLAIGGGAIAAYQIASARRDSDEAAERERNERTRAETEAVRAEVGRLVARAQRRTASHEREIALAQLRAAASLGPVGVAEATQFGLFVLADQPQPIVLSGHDGEIESTAWHPDGRLMTASRDGTAVVWDPRTARKLDTLWEHRPPPSAMSFSPDGTQLALVPGIREAAHGAKATLFGRNTLEEMDASELPGWVSRRPVTDTRMPTGDPSHAVSTAWDGRHTASARWADFHVYVWDQGHSPEHRLAGSIGAVAFSPDGAVIATASGAGQVALWNAAAGAPLRVVEAPASGFAVAFSRDGALAAATTRDGAVVIDVATGRQVSAPTGHTSDVVHVAFSPDGGRLVTASRDGTARLWNARSGAALRTLVPTNSSDTVIAAAFSPDGRHLVTISEGTPPASCWDAETGAMEHRLDDRTGTGGPNLVSGAIAFSPDGRLVLLAAFDRTARLLDLGTGDLLRSFEHEDVITAVAFSHDGSRVLTASLDGSTRLWDASTGTVELILRGGLDVGTGPLQHQVFDAVLTADSTMIATRVGDGATRIWDAATGALFHEWRTSDVRAMGDLAISRDGLLATAGSADGAVQLWQLTRPDATAVLRDTASRSNLRVCRQSYDVVPVVLEPTTDPIWADATLCPKVQ